MAANPVASALVAATSVAAASLAAAAPEAAAPVASAPVAAAPVVAADGAAAARLQAALLFSFFCSCLLLSFSLLLSLGGCLLARLRVLRHAGERAVADAALPLQLKLNSSSPCLVSSVNRAHLPLATQLL